jgi:hypothetical protein
MFQEQPKPIAERASEAASQGLETAKEGITSAATTAQAGIDSIRESVSNLTTSIPTSVNDTSESVKEFVDSNSMISRIGFVILVLILFVISLRICMSIMGIFFAPSTSPYVVKGLLSGNQSLNVSQDPKNTDAVNILRSNNQSTGVECTWSVWLNVSPTTSDEHKFSNIFVKGDGNFDNENLGGLSSVDNGPGLYVYDISNGKVTGNYGLVAFWNVMGGSQTNLNGVNVPNSFVEVQGIPLNKWFHCAFRLQNTLLDMYINGNLANRTILPDVPKQNYADIFVNGNGGFQGSLSNLRYYPYALNAFQIGSIAWWGPNLKTSDLSSVATSNNGYTYLSNMWYNNNIAST